MPLPAPVMTATRFVNVFTRISCNEASANQAADLRLMLN
jgi:hypothetical protein